MQYDENPESGEEEGEDIEISSAEEAEMESSDGSFSDVAVELPKNTNSIKSSVNKFGKKFVNVSPINTEEEIKKNDWLLVGFPTESKKSSASNNLRFFICQIMQKNPNGIVGNFLRGKQTRDFPGYIYQFPDEKELTEFSFNQVVGKVEPPSKYLRGYLKFQVDFNAF